MWPASDGGGLICLSAKAGAALKRLHRKERKGFAKDAKKTWTAIGCYTLEFSGWRKFS